METAQIEARPRDTKRGEAARLRRQGSVPCNVYGHGITPVPCQLPLLVARKLVFSPEKRPVRITVEGQAWDCVVKHVSLMPRTGDPAHIDLQAVQQNEAVTLPVPVHLVGTAPGVLHGGDLQISAHELTVTCLPGDIPAHIEVDVSGLGIGQSVHVADLNVQGIRFHEAPEKTIVSVMAPRVAAPEETEEAGGEAKAADAEKTGDE